MKNSFCKYLNNEFKDIPKNNITDQKPIKQKFICSENVVPKLNNIKISDKQKNVPIVSQISTSMDILSAHNIIINYLTNKYNNIDKYMDRMKKLEWIKTNTTDEIERIDANKELFKLKKQINSIQNYKELNNYKSEVNNYIEKYKSQKNIKKSFLLDSKNDDIENQLLQKKFFAIAKDYIEVIQSTNINKKILCDECGNSDFYINSDNLYSCKNCYNCVQIIDENHSYKDIDRINLSARYTYTKKGHFKEAIDKFQAIQNTNIPDEVYDMIYTQMDKYNISKESITKEQLYFFLSEYKYSKYYEDITLIYYVITQKSPPNISMYQNDLLNYFDVAESAYEKIKDNSRINSLNVNYKLMKLLEILGYKINKEDFNLLKTRDRIGDHDEDWKKICEYLNWRFIPTI